MTEIYLHIVARMADYMATHPYRKQQANRLQKFGGKAAKLAQMGLAGNART